ncbi:MAG: phosphate signaling complex protein PhoU [Bacillota bacterium]
MSSGKEIPRRGFDAALSELFDETLALAGQVEKALHLSVQSLKERDIDLAKEIVEGDDVIDDAALEVDQSAERIIAKFSPVSSDLRRIISTMRISRDLERIADLAVNIAKITQEMAGEPLLKPLIDIPRMASIAQGMVRDCLTALIEENLDQASDVYYRDEEIDALYMQIFRELLSYMIEDPRSVHRAIPLLFVARHLERVGDHATNIAETVAYLLTGEREMPQKEGGFEGQYR